MVGLLFSIFGGWGFVCVYDFLQSFPVVAIIFKDIGHMLNGLFSVFGCGTQAITAAELPFEGGHCYIRVLAGLGLDADVGVRFFIGLKPSLG